MADRAARDRRSGDRPRDRPRPRRTGYALTLSARRPEKLEEAVEGAARRRLRAADRPANVADEEELLASSPPTSERYGRLDALVNNAGVGIGGAMDEMRPSTSTCSSRSTCAR